MKTFDPKHNRTVEVRQGDRNQMNKRVLIISLIVVVIALGLVWAWFAYFGAANSLG